MYHSIYVFATITIGHANFAKFDCSMFLATYEQHINILYVNVLYVM